jgi:hypothetical protein
VGVKRYGARARRPTLSGRAVTIAAPGWTFEVQLEEDEWHMLWLNSPNRVTGKREGRYLLSAVLKVGWRIVRGRHPRSRRCSRRTGSGAGGCSDAAWARQPSMAPKRVLLVDGTLGLSFRLIVRFLFPPSCREATGSVRAGR